LLIFNRGPTKLLRKIYLIPPGKNWGENNTDIDTVFGLSMQAWADIYASGADIRFGIRIVAGYNGCIVLFSIPPDVFNQVNDHANGEQSHPVQRYTLGSNHPSWNNQDSVKIRGCYVNTVDGLVDLAVDSGPTTTVLAFSADGIVRVYQLDGSVDFSNAQVIRKTVGKGGWMETR
jgi:hypothetical protein